jgi:hypothetical protein
MLARVVFELAKRVAAGVAFVPLQHATPLRCAHRTGARICQQVDEHIVGMEHEQIEASSDQCILALPSSRCVQRLDSFDTKRLNNCAGLPFHNRPPMQLRCTLADDNSGMGRRATALLSEQHVPGTVHTNTGARQQSTWPVSPVRSPQPG